MLLRRITEHVKAQNWFAVGIDFFIVVVGVFIGIQVANWNETRQLRETTKTYYARLAEDLRTELRNQEALTAYYTQVKNHGIATLERMENGETDVSERFFIDAYQASQMRTYTPQRATYNELLSTGIASAIPDAALRSRLANYYLTLHNAERVQAETTPYRSNLRTYMPYALQNDIREQCKEQFFVQDDSSLVVDLAKDCKLTASPELLQRSFDALAQYDSMEMDLGRHLSDIDLKLASFTVYHQSTTNTLDALIKEID